MTELPMLSTVVHEAVQKERLEIIRMLHAEAAKHQDAAEKLRADYDYREVGDDVHAHESDARLIDRIADLILARYEIAF